MSILERISIILKELDVDRLEEVLDFAEFLKRKDSNAGDPERADSYKMSEKRLAESWSSPEDEDAWKDL